jgi:uncharacterized SAM-binding protein YcdF (DUF218 family)
MGDARRGDRRIKRQQVRLIAATVIIFVGLILRFLSIGGMQFSFYICCGISFLLLLWSGIDTLERFGKKKLSQVCKGFLTLLILAGSAMLFVAEAFVISGAHTEVGKKADCILILGAGVNGSTLSLSLQSRLDTALAYLTDHPSLPIVVSGGQGSGEDISEAEAMRRYLTDHGIPNDQIYVEDQSRNTAENMQFSKALMEMEQINHQTVAVVSNEFHLYRAKRLAASTGIQAIGVAAETPYLMLRVNYFIREAFALLQQAVFS